MQTIPAAQQHCLIAIRITAQVARAADEIPSTKVMADNAGFGASALDGEMNNSLEELEKESATPGLPGSAPNTPSSAVG